MRRLQVQCEAAFTRLLHLPFPPAAASSLCPPPTHPPTVPPIPSIYRSCFSRTSHPSSSSSLLLPSAIPDFSSLPSIHPFCPRPPPPPDILLASSACPPMRLVRGRRERARGREGGRQ
eukprot:3251097-Rhodomonas_salina.4